ncbi:hypothetical protein CAEBREN_04657 [Caenorhabditis brenneri]|uniref:Uncharacterized protein n=1 Tax=Caenorhabditis brenneri TaxID=135651 RepID=G0NNR4_CAEBE|nr:hypothetical protein CAEBREN_04657 [Caenorhabditis brenneri]
MPEVPESIAETPQTLQIDDNALEAQQPVSKKQVLLQKFSSFMETCSPQLKSHCMILLAEAVAFFSDPTNAPASAAEFCESFKKKLQEVDLPEDVKN